MSTPTPVSARQCCWNECGHAFCVTLVQLESVNAELKQLSEAHAVASESSQTAKEQQDVALQALQAALAGSEAAQQARITALEEAMTMLRNQAAARVGAANGVGEHDGPQKAPSYFWLLPSRWRLVAWQGWPQHSSISHHQCVACVAPAFVCAAGRRI